MEEDGGVVRRRVDYGSGQPVTTMCHPHHLSPPRLIDFHELQGIVRGELKIPQSVISLKVRWS